MANQAERTQGLSGFRKPKPVPFAEAEARANERQKNPELNQNCYQMSFRNGRLQELVNMAVEDEAFGRIAV
ncbi:MAG: hypothetical protein U0T82_04450 [Bacteroidales bacterium]